MKLDFSGQQNALSRVNQAISQGPRYREVDVSSGTEAAARFTGAASQEIQRMLARNQEITDQRKMYANETMLKAAQIEIDAELQGENDPNKWMQIYDERFPTILQKMDLEGMSPEAAESMKAYADRLHQLGRVKTLTGSVQQNQALLVRDTDARYKNAVLTGNALEAGQALKEKAELTGMTPNEVALEATEAGNQIVDVNRREVEDKMATFMAAGQWKEGRQFLHSNEHLNKPGNEGELLAQLKALDKGESTQEWEAIISQRPKEGRARLANMEDPKVKELVEKDPVLHAALVKKAEVGILNRSSMQARQIEEALAGGMDKTVIHHKLKDPVHFPDLTEAMRLELQKATSVVEPPNDPGEYQGYLESIYKYKSTGNKVEDEARLTQVEVLAKMRFSGEPLSSINRAVTEARNKINGKDEEADPVPKQIVEAYNIGALGNFKFAWDTLKNEEGSDALLSPEDLAKKSTFTKSSVVENQKLKALASKSLQEMLALNAQLKKEGISASKRAEIMEEKAAAIRATSGVVHNAPLFYAPMNAGDTPNPLFGTPGSPPPTQQTPSAGLNRAKQLIDLSRKEDPLNLPTK